MSKYQFKPYNALFPTLFEQEKQRISPHLDPTAIIEHIGSTAVPNLGGKGIIDIAVAVDRTLFEETKRILQSLGYEFRPAFSTESRFYFVIFLDDREMEKRRYHLHLTPINSREFQEFIEFRDSLRKNPKMLLEYAAIKEKAASLCEQEGELYRKMKEPIFQKFQMKKNDE
jgi:GrpB-like predicted nucleotidyltransferase (UPF0157 family)